MMQIANLEAGQDVDGIELVRQGVDSARHLPQDRPRPHGPRRPPRPAREGPRSPSRKAKFKEIDHEKQNRDPHRSLPRPHPDGGPRPGRARRGRRPGRTGQGRDRLQAGLRARPRGEVVPRPDGDGRPRPPVPEERLGRRRPLLVLLLPGEARPVRGVRLQVLPEVRRRLPRQRLDRRRQVEHDPPRPGPGQGGQARVPDDHRILRGRGRGRHPDDGPLRPAGHRRRRRPQDDHRHLRQGLELQAQEPDRVHARRDGIARSPGQAPGHHPSRARHGGPPRRPLRHRLQGRARSRSRP